MEQEVQEVETETTAVEETETNSADVVEKTFTQDEVNNIVKERLAKENKGIPSKEELAKYNEWKESQKTQEDKYNDLIKSNGEKDTTITTLRMENEVLKAGITDPDDIDYVVYKVSKMDGDFSDNLQEYLTNNPKFVKRQETKATGVEIKPTNVVQETGVNAILRAKHPELFED